MRGVTFTPFAGLGDNYLQISLLLRWAVAQNEDIAIVCLHDGFVPPAEQRAMSAIHVRKDLLDLLESHPRVTFVYLNDHHPYPYTDDVHRCTPRIVFYRDAVPTYWPFDASKFSRVELPTAPYVATAFDSVSWPEHKRFSDEEIEQIRSHYRSRGYEILDIGGRRPLAETAYLIAHSSGFAGADSGLVHLAAGIGKETHVYVPGPIIKPFYWYVKTMVHNGVKYQANTRAKGFRFFDFGR